MLSQIMHADIAKFVQERAHSKENGWKWPRYLDSFSALSTKEHWLGIDKPQSRLNKGIRSLINTSLGNRLSAAYIEWKYYSVLSDGFHGIIGVSLYNPEVKFNKIADGGMLCVLAGESRKNDSGNAHRGKENVSFVWMKLFPLASLSGLQNRILTVQCERAKLTLEDNFESNCGHIHLSDGESIRLEARFRGPAHPPAPLIGSGMNPLPISGGGHWIVNNRMPFGVTDGTLSVDSSITKNSVIQTEWSNAPAYFEHSYGLNPLPWQGWDFFFAPLESLRGGAVFQSYRNCQSLKQLDVTWTSAADGKPQTTFFDSSELTVEWSHKEYDPNLAAWIPRQRILRGRNAQFEIILTNTIALTLPFLRRQTAALRCFFIGEQIGTASWVVKDLKGNVVDEQRNIRAGGEIAYARFPSLGRLYQPFPV